LQFSRYLHDLYLTCPKRTSLTIPGSESAWKYFYTKIIGCPENIPFSENLYAIILSIKNNNNNKKI